MGALSFQLSALSLAIGLAACRLTPSAQQGGKTTTTFGGMAGPSVVTNTAPENPQTPSTTTVKKTTERVYEIPHNTTATGGTQGDSAREHPETSPRSAAARFESRDAGVPVQGASPASNVSGPGAAAPARILRETVVEEATTQTGSSWRDTARELGVKLKAMSPFVWVGALMVPLGLWLAWRAWSEWKINAVLIGLGISGSGIATAAIAVWSASIHPAVGLSGLGLVVFAAVIWGVYYRAHHDSRTASS